MALLFYDGFDWAGSESDLNRKWDGISLNDINSTYGRFESNGVAMTSTAHHLSKTIIEKTTIYFGVAFRTASNSMAYSSTYSFIAFKSGSTAQVKFHFKGAATVAFYNGSGTQIGTDITIPIIQNHWVYLEFKVTISDTVGEIIFKINGTTIYSGTNLDTRNGTPTGIDVISITGVYNNITTYLDDFYIDDSQFHGDVRVRTIYPDANGSENDFTPNTGSNYQAVDDPGNPDDDTTYNSANTVGDRDLYGVTAPTLATVKAISVSNMVRKDDAGDREIKGVVRSGGTNYLGTAFYVPSNYNINQSIWETDPQDSQAWTKAKIDAAEFGLEITA